MGVDLSDLSATPPLCSPSALDLFHHLLLTFGPRILLVALSPPLRWISTDGLPYILRLRIILRVILLPSPSLAYLYGTGGNSSNIPLQGLQGTPTVREWDIQVICGGNRISLQYRLSYRSWGWLILGDES